MKYMRIIDIDENKLDENKYYIAIHREYIAPTIFNTEMLDVNEGKYLCKYDKEIRFFIILYYFGNNKILKSLNCRVTNRDYLIREASDSEVNEAIIKSI